MEIIKYDKEFTEKDGLSMKDRFEKYESSVTKLRVTNELPVVVRLDGHKFGALTEKYKIDAPFSKEFGNAMILSAMTLLWFSGADIMIVGSDEVSLIFKPRLDRSGKNLVELPFGGRILKMSTLYAGYMSMAFSQKFVEPGFFDARVFNIPEFEVLNYIMSRQVSLHTNAVSEYAHYYIGKKSTNKLNSDQKIEKLKEVGVDFDAVCDPHFRYGTIYIMDGRIELCQRLRRSEMSEELIDKIEYKK